MCSHGGEFFFTRTIPFWNIHTPCVVTRARVRRVRSYTDCINAVCSHGVSFLTRIISLGNMYTPCVVMGARTGWVYSYTEYIYIYTPCVVTGVSFPHQDYSFMEYVHAVCSVGGEDSPGIFLYGVYTHPM